MWTRCCHPPFQKEQEIMKSPNPLQMAGRREGWRRNGGSPRFSSPRVCRCSRFNIFFFFFLSPPAVKDAPLEPGALISARPQQRIAFIRLYICLNIMLVRSPATLLETPAYFIDHLIKWPASDCKDARLGGAAVCSQRLHCRPRSQPLAV